ncbi:MAG: hypothetical protein K6T94_09950 [Paenibacillus sp.]|nr:hypothetical protein [Paenibacillus sp.]
MDKKAKKVLLNTFWTASGWKDRPDAFAGEDFNYAKDKGLMFDPITINHDQLVERIQELNSTMTKERVASAFLHSLSTKKVYLRSALSSWALTTKVPLHSYGERSVILPNYSRCGDCNFHSLMSEREYVNVDLNVLNFERIKWGGIRLNDLLYCWLDLELFIKEEVVEPTAEDIAILHKMTKVIQECEDHESARSLEKRLKDIIPSSKNERDVIMEVWGYAGLLVQRDTPRKLRGGYHDFNSVAGWQGDDGYSQEALEYYFGAYL